MRAAAESCLETLASKALDVIAYALDQSDPKTAIAVLRGVGLLSGTPTDIGSCNPRIVRMRNKTARRNEAAEANDEAMLAELRA